MKRFTLLFVFAILALLVTSLSTAQVTQDISITTSEPLQLSFVPAAIQTIEIEGKYQTVLTIPKIEVRSESVSLENNDVIRGLNSLLVIAIPVLISPANYSSVPLPPSGQGVPLTWGAVPGAIEYQLRAYLEVGVNWILVSDWKGTSTTASMFGLQEGYSMKWEVRAMDAAHAYGEWSPQWFFTIGPLPVKLLTFSGMYTAGKGSVLSWTTVSEVSNYGFEVQRSVTSNPVGFTTIGFVPGNNTTLERHDYTYTDTAPPSGKTYYRLKQVDLNGAFEYSGLVSIEITTSIIAGVGEGNTPTAFVLDQNYPNPFNPTTTVSYGLPKEAPVSLVIYNTLGERVLGYELGVRAKGLHAFTLDASTLPSGTYVYRVTAGNFVGTKTMVVLK
jgi:hypothetical protein